MNLIQLSQRLRNLRVARGYTLEQVSEMTGLTRGVLSKVENFRVTPSLATLTKIASAFGVSMSELFEGLDEKPEARQLVSATIAAELCRRLYAGGVRQFHFYTLNRAELSYAICHMLGLRPKAAS